MRRVLVMIVLVGCTADVAGVEGRDAPDTGSGGKSETPGTTSITLSKYFDEIAAVQCQQAFMCRSSFPEVERGYAFEAEWGNTVAKCERSLIDNWNPAQVETEIAKGRITYDGAAAVSCLQGVTFAACPDYWNRGVEWAESCYQVVVGMVQAGGACENDYSCTSFMCDVTTQRCL